MKYTWVYSVVFQVKIIDYRGAYTFVLFFHIQEHIQLSLSSDTIRGPKIIKWI